MTTSITQIILAKIRQIPAKKREPRIIGFMWKESMSDEEMVSAEKNLSRVDFDILNIADDYPHLDRVRASILGAGQAVRVVRANDPSLLS